MLDLIQPSSGYIKNKNIIVSESEEWKPFTSSFIDESFLIGYLTAEEFDEWVRPEDMIGSLKSWI